MKERKKYIGKLFPEIFEIKNPDLQMGVVKTWEKGMDLGEWENIEALPFTLLIPNVTVSIVEHVRVVTKMCLNVAESLGLVHGGLIEQDYLLAGALLHDVGKLVEYERKGKQMQKSHRGVFLRHPFIGAWLALEAGLPYEIVHIIATHSHEGDKEPRSSEALVVHCCDFLHFNLIRRLATKQ